MVSPWGWSVDALIIFPVASSRWTASRVAALDRRKSSQTSRASASRLAALVWRLGFIIILAIAGCCGEQQPALPIAALADNFLNALVDRQQAWLAGQVCRLDEIAAAYFCSDIHFGISCFE